MKNKFEQQPHFSTPVEAPTTEYNPKRNIRRESDVQVPFQQTLITAVLVSTALTIAPLMLIYIVDGVWLHWGVPIFYVLPFAFAFWIMVFCVAAVISWFHYEQRIYDTIWRLENITGLDFNNDGVVGDPGRFPALPFRQIPRTKNSGTQRETHDMLRAIGDSQVDEMYWQTFAVLVLCRGVLISRERINGGSYESNMDAYPNISQDRYNKMYAEIKHLILETGQPGKTLFDWLAKFVPANERITVQQPNHDPAPLQ